jgi:hypothetical protein
MHGRTKIRVSIATGLEALAISGAIAAAPAASADSKGNETAKEKCLLTIDQLEEQKDKLAHEITYVIQQAGQHRHDPSEEALLASAMDAYEQRAEEVAAAVLLYDHGR